MNAPFPFKGPLKLAHECVGVGDRHNDHRVFIVDADGSEVLGSSGAIEYITQVFPDCPKDYDFCGRPTFMQGEPPPYSERARFILRALNAALTT